MQLRSSLRAGGSVCGDSEGKHTARETSLKLSNSLDVWKDMDAALRQPLKLIHSARASDQVASS